jgi:malonyl-CoA/methylmalonyl-CoA synthetase
MSPFTCVDLGDDGVAAWTVSAWERHLGRAVPSMEALRRDLGEGTMPTAFAAAAVRAGDRPALDIASQRATHRELHQRAAAFATGLRAFGVRPEQVVALAAPPSVDTVAAYLALLRLGAVVLPLSPGATQSETSLVLADSGAEVLVTNGPGVGARLPGTTRVICVDAHGEADAALADLAHDTPGAPPGSLDPDTPALLAYTSGTTGRPKSVPLTHRNLLSSIRGVMWAWRWKAGDVLVHALPLHHQHGLGGLHAALLSGGRLVLRPRFDPVGVLSDVERSGATVLFGVPAMHQRLVADVPARLAAATSLRLITSGSAPLPPTLARQMAALTGALPLERYGSTEAGLDVSNLYEGPRVPGSIGLPLPGVEIAIADGDGATQPAGEPGELLLRGPQVFRGYGGDVGETSAAFFGEWFRTGDIAVVDERTELLRIVGRSKDVIISGGMNVYPQEVENALLDLPDIAAAAVVGVPSSRWGEEVVAAVVAEPPSTVDTRTVGARLRERLSGYKCPKRIAVIAALPHNDMGKIDRAAVRRLVSETAGDEGVPS